MKADASPPSNNPSADIVGLAVSARLDRLTSFVAIIGFGGLVILAFLIFYDGIARWLWLPRLFGMNDYGEAIYPLVIASCFPAALLRSTNVSITFAGKALGRIWNGWLEAFAALVTLGFFIVIVWQFTYFTDRLGFRMTRTAVLPLEPFWWGATAIMALCVPVQAWVAAIKFYCAVSGRGIAPDDEVLRSYREG